jgi:hypothetical protein
MHSRYANLPQALSKRQCQCRRTPTRVDLAHIEGPYDQQPAPSCRREGGRAQRVFQQDGAVSECRFIGAT